MDKDIRDVIIITTCIIALIVEFAIGIYVEKICEQLDNPQNGCINYNGEVYCKNNMEEK